MFDESDILQKQLELQRQIEILEDVAKQYLTKEAITRYYTLKSAHPQKAIQAITIIAQLAQQGQLKEKLTDEQFKNLLLNMDQYKKNFKIKKI